MKANIQSLFKKKGSCVRRGGEGSEEAEITQDPGELDCVVAKLRCEGCVLEVGVA